MSLTYKGTAIFAGQYGNKAKVVVSHVSDTPGDFDTFLTTLTTTYSDATLLSSGHTTENIPVVALPTDGTNSDRRAVCYFKNATRNTTVRLTIPCPKDAILVEETEGERVTVTAMNNLAVALGNLCEETFVPIQGYVIQKK